MKKHLEKLLIVIFVIKKYKGDDEPVRHHCHVTGKFRDSAHQACNLKLQISAEKIKIPVIFHNLKGYDSHFIIQQLGDLVGDSPPPPKTPWIIRAKRSELLQLMSFHVMQKNIWLFILTIILVLLIA